MTFPWLRLLWCWLTLFLVVGSGCERQVEVLPSVDFRKIVKGRLLAPAIYDVRLVETGKEELLELRSGAILRIPEEAFVNERGEAIRGVVEIVIDEVTDNAKMVSQDLVTVTTDGLLLSSRGMYYFSVRQGEEELALAPDKFLELFLPGEEDDYQGYDTFYGKKNDLGTVEWERDTSTGDSVALSWERPYQISSILYWASDEDTENAAALDSLLNLSPFEDLIPAEVQAIAGKEILVHWTLFNDGELAPLLVEGDITTSLSNKLLRLVEELPRLPASTGARSANTKGYFYLTAYQLEPELMNRYSMRLSRLGWVNCDLFWRMKVPLGQQTVEISRDTAYLKLIYPQYQTVIGAEQKAQFQYHFSGVPAGISAHLVAFAPGRNSRVALSVTPFVGGESVAELAPFQDVNQPAMDSILNQLR